MEIIIRPYKTEDCTSILEIVNYTILNSTALYEYLPRTLEQQQNILANKLLNGFPVFVAENNGFVVGFGLFGTFRFKEAYKNTIEHSVYVSIESQGKGIGKKLLSALIEKAKAQNYHTMIAVIDAENKSSIRFHENFDFKTVGYLKETGFKFNRWLDTVFMQLMLLN